MQAKKQKKAVDLEKITKIVEFKERIMQNAKEAQKSPQEDVGFMIEI